MWALRLSHHARLQLSVMLLILFLSSSAYSGTTTTINVCADLSGSGFSGASAASLIAKAQTLFDDAGFSATDAQCLKLRDIAPPASGIGP